MRGTVNRNPNWISIEEVLRREGRSLLQIAKGTICGGAVAPALCKAGCLVELEGSCEHGCPSIIKALMIHGYEWSEIPEEKKYCDRMGCG